MRLITWNVNSIRARWPRVVELLAEHEPDVVCVQETKVGTEVFPHEPLAAVGYRAIQRSEGRWNGVALLVPRTADVGDVRDVLPGEPDPGEARWVEARVDGVRVASVYVPNGRDRDHPMFAAKLRFLEAMRARAEHLRQTGAAVIAGDVNVAPTDRDVWDVDELPLTTHVTAAERERLAAIVDAGFADSFRAVEPSEPGFTWWDYRAGAFARGMGMRIDLALTSADLRVLGCWVDTRFRRNNEAGDKPSDHAPVVLDIAR